MPELSDEELQRREERAKQMFRELRKYIGKEVEVTFVKNGNVVKYKGLLREMRDFLYVDINSFRLPFIDLGVAIMSITRNDRVLYYNPFIKDYYIGRDGEKELISEEMFGLGKIKSEDAIEAAYQKKHPEKYTDGFLERHRRDLQTYIDEGLSYIEDEELKKEWRSACIASGFSFEGAALLQRTVEMMRLLARANNCEEVIETFKEKYHMPIEELAQVVKKAAYYSSRGEVLETYWNALYSEPNIPQSSGRGKK
jgi:hypothetical protein